MKLKNLIPPERIVLDIDSTSTEDVIQSLVDVLVDSGLNFNRDEVIRNVIDRERQVGTGVGYGVAIPHAEPGPYGQPAAVFARLAKPVDFHAPDGKKANLVFLLLTPDKTPALHVRLLARICRLTRSENLRQQLLKAKDKFEAANTISEIEASFPELTP